jgi:hypothetical protein
MLLLYVFNLEQESRVHVVQCIPATPIGILSQLYSGLPGSLLPEKPTAIIENALDNAFDYGESFRD